MHLEPVWDDDNLEHATRRASTSEIGQAIHNATHYAKGRTDASGRARIESATDGGRRLVVIVEVLGRGKVRPITAWDLT